MAYIATSVIYIHDLPTETVNLTPTGVTVVREIHTKIQPGLNEVTVLGLDPTVDTDSIRIEGSGPATITDIQASIVERRTTFEDVFGESESSNEDTDADLPMSLRALRLERIQAREHLEKARTDETTATQVLRFLDAYGTKMTPEHMNGTNLNEFIERYIERRSTESARSHKAKLDIEKNETRLETLTKKITKLEAQRQKAREKIKRQQAQKNASAIRKRRDQFRFWTKTEGQVTVLLDSQSSSSSVSGTPDSSRRGSVVSMTEKSSSDIDIDGDNGDEREIKLVLRYVLPGPKWESCYELSINTPSPAPTGKLIYSAEFQNQTSETWTNARVTLSTSPTSLFSGLGKTIPSLSAWHVELAVSEQDSNERPKWENIVQSVPEKPLTLPGARLPNLPAGMSYEDYKIQLMLLEDQNKRRLELAQKGQSQPQPQQMQQMQRQSQQQQQAQQQMLQQAMQAQRMQQTQQAQQARPSPPAPPAPPAAQAMRHGEMNQAQPITMTQMAQAQQARRMLRAPNLTPIDVNMDLDEALNMADFTADNNATDESNLAYEDSTRQEYGMTTKYDLPGRRTLTPSSVNRRHALARIDLKSITLQHVIVPKSRPVAFLRANIKNTSSVQILRGRVGIKVDGTFLGTTRIPNCAPNDSLELSLGVDPSILVTYSKPSMRRQTSGMFVKEEVAVFKRSVWVKNTKAKRTNIVVLDQIPVTNSEKLQLAILEPNGLAKEGDKTEVDTEGKGQCVARMGKDGEVRWLLDLDAGKSIRLVLEYEMKAPTGHNVS